MEFIGKKILVIGMARSGVAVSALLSRHGANVMINDRKSADELGAALDELKGLPIDWRLGEDPVKLMEEADGLVISPGVPIDAPAVKRARELGKPVEGEIEVAYRLSRGRVAAITGTNGKTTTTTLLSEMFKNAGKTTYTVGNIGFPFSAIADRTTPDDVIVCEVSSFQLESIDKFRPTVSAILNITEDHLNRHGTMDEYIRMKKRIFENQRRDDVCVLNYDDPTTRAMAADMIAQPVFFSRLEKVAGAYVENGEIYYGGEFPRAVCRVDEVRIPGPHNLENALAAVAMAVNSDIPLPVIRHTLKTFAGVEHRIEFVRELRGVRFINDSKGTNVDSTLKAIATMNRPTVMILGGSTKHSDYMPMARAMVESPYIVGAVVIGATTPEITPALDAAGFGDYVLGAGFEEAILKAQSMAPEGGNVLLSPACASFDMFDNFEQRGEVFKRIVNALE